MNSNQICPCCNSNSVLIKELPQRHLLCLKCNHIQKLPSEFTGETNYAQKSQRSARLPDDTNVKNRERLDFITRSIKSSKATKVLEIGAAEGFFAQYFIDNNKPSIYDAIELSEDAIACAKVVDTLYREEIENIHLPDNNYDLIFSFHVLEHLEELEPFLSSSFRILKDDGLLVLEVPNEHGNKKVPWDFNPEHLHIFNSLSILNLLHRHDFEIEKLETGGFESPYYNDSIRLVAQKKSNANREKNLKNTYQELITNDDIAFWGADGDFLSYVLPYLEASPPVFDSAPDIRITDTWVTSSPGNVREHKGKILVCSHQFEDEIIDLLRRRYDIKSDRILKLSDLIGN